MNYARFCSRHAILAMAVVLFLSLFLVGQLSAQEVYDVRVKSGWEGAASEFPLVYSVEYENGELQEVAITGEGTFTFTAPAGAGAPVAIWWFGVRIFIGADLFCTAADPWGGCWCLCLKWVDVTWPPWQVRPMFFWYYDPCCN